MCIVLSICVAAALIVPASASVNLPHMTLTVIGSKGATVVLNETGIGNLPSYRAVGGRINSVGTKSGLGSYTGVCVNTFCQMVGGLHLGQTLRVTGSDGYVQSFTYVQVNGDFTTYDTSGHEVQHNQPLTTILAYYFNDKNLTSGGPLRFAIVGPEGLCTDSTYWVKYVVKMEVFGEAVPEFSSLLVLPLFIFATLVATFGLKACRRRHSNANKFC